MLVDARTLPNATVIVGDVCIIGAGAAGITLARELASRDTSVIVLESGFLESDDATQALYDGDARGLTYFPLGDAQTRTRQFGGSTNRWNGECRPLDALDFEARDWVPDSGWPFGLDELRPWYERAQSVCELSPHGYCVADWPRARPLAPADDRVVPVAVQYSPPTRFGRAYLDEARTSSDTTVYLGANVVDLVTSRSPTTIDAVEVACLDGTRFTVTARVFVLATGGVENARLLLAANRVHPRGLGNEHDLVGRYFMEHLYLDNAGTIDGVPRLGRDYARAQNIGGHWIQWAIALSETEQRRSRITNFAAMLSGALTPRWQVGRRRSATLALKNVMEQAPNRTSRVTLSSSVDALGMPRALLDWQVSDLDVRSAQHAHRALDESLSDAGMGKVVASRCTEGRFPADLRGARHHMGTTRMHVDPRRGVVDADCRVHGTDNLFVAGSSVFPTSGSANPTLTIVALALRLAHHLRGRMSTGALPLPARIA